MAPEVMSGLHLKRLHLDTDSVTLALGPKDHEYERMLGIHVEVPWSQCVREFDAPFRIYLHLYDWGVTIGEKSQVWTRTEGNTERFRWITWSPRRGIQCRAPHRTTKWGREKEWQCGRLKGHKGEHA